MRYILLILITINSYAGILDFNYLQKAKESYNKGDYKLAQTNYMKISNDQARYNLANSLYKQKKYQEALDIYKTINDKNLEFKKLHNIGNSLAKLGKTKEAIKTYENALKIQDDKDTKFNLELLKKQQQKKKQDKKDNKKQNKKNKENKKQDKKDKKKQNKNSKGENKKKNQDQKKQDSKDKQKEKKKQNSKQQKDKEQKDKQNKKAQKEKQKGKQEQKKGNKKQPPISNMQERKWQRKLDQRGINTLLLPIKKGENKDEKPW